MNIRKNFRVDDEELNNFLDTVSQKVGSIDNDIKEINKKLHALQIEIERIEINRIETERKHNERKREKRN